MITPRQTRLVRVPDLASLQATLTAVAADLQPAAARDTFVIVPTRAAGEQLRRTLEERILDPERPAHVWPVLATRADLYDELQHRLPASASAGRPPQMLSAFEREVILASVSRGLVDEGLAPPFEIRPGLVAEMLALYDLVRRLGRTVADFERNFRLELEKDCEFDRGAEKLLQQTVFLAAAYNGYEARVAAAGALDEHALRALLIRDAPERPVRRIVVTVADRIADADGLWPADYDLLTKLPHLEAIDIVSTEAVLAAGVLERLHGFLPELQDTQGTLAAVTSPVLLVPAARQGGTPVFSYRDREEELSAVARRLKVERNDERSSPLHRTALVVRRPLPYLYLARGVFADAGVPFETLDTLPLAAEPFAAVVDLALEAVSADFTRSTVLALARSPHLRFAPEPAAPPAGAPATRFVRGGVGEAGQNNTAASEAEPLVPDSAVRGGASLAALDFALSEARYLGGLDRLETLAARWSGIDAPASRAERRSKTAAPAAAAIVPALRSLAPLATPRAIADQLETLLAWLRRYDRNPVPPPEAVKNDAAASEAQRPVTAPWVRGGASLAASPPTARRRRVRAAVLGALESLAAAYRAHDPGAAGDATLVSAAIRRWLGSQTVAVATGEAGLQILDAQAARYGDVDDVQLVGLIDGEWPDRFRRNVLYPSSLMAQLEPLPAVADQGRRERDALNAARAAFADLLRLPRRRLRVSTFALENDAVVEPSVLIDQIEAAGLVQQSTEEPAIRVFASEALALDPRAPEVLPLSAGRWAAARLNRPIPVASRFQGETGPWIFPRVSVSRLERYLDCPFRFYASEVLRLEEQPDDEDTRTPLERGRFLHQLFERFFSEWHARGHRRIDPATLGDARQLFASVCEEALSALSPGEATLERTRLLGSAVSAGIAHRVLAMEADRPREIVDRLLEHALEGDFRFAAADGRERTVTLKAYVDRIDLLDDGTIRVIDYKSKKTPDPKVALQLPIYSLCARTSLEGHANRHWALAEAIYVSFEGEKAVVPLRPPKGGTLDEVLADAQARMLTTLERIGEGHFPPQPQKKSLCSFCPYGTVCRHEYVDAPRATEASGAQHLSAEAPVNSAGAKADE